MLTPNDRTLTGDNSLLRDEIYLRCYEIARSSTCDKMQFGCVITHNQAVIHQSCNRRLNALKALCEPTCIRLSLISRTDSMLGACTHAEECLWDVVHSDVPIDECELFVAGFYPDGSPWLKTVAEHTCLRCAVQMHYAKLKMIYVPVTDRWEGLTTEEALKTALAYASRQKRIETRA